MYENKILKEERKCLRGGTSWNNENSLVERNCIEIVYRSLDELTA